MHACYCNLCNLLIFLGQSEENDANDSVRVIPLNRPEKKQNVPSSGKVVLDLKNAIEEMQARFVLKITSNTGISQENVDEIIAFSEDIHNSKMELIIHQLKYRFGEENSIAIKDIIENIRLVDNVAGKYNLIHFLALKIFRPGVNF